MNMIGTERVLDWLLSQGIIGEHETLWRIPDHPPASTLSIADLPPVEHSDEEGGPTPGRVSSPGSPRILRSPAPPASAPASSAASSFQALGRGPRPQAPTETSRVSMHLVLVGAPSALRSSHRLLRPAPSAPSLAPGTPTGPTTNTNNGTSTNPSTVLKTLTTLSTTITDATAAPSLNLSLSPLAFFLLYNVASPRLFSAVRSTAIIVYLSTTPSPRKTSSNNNQIPCHALSLS